MEFGRLENIDDVDWSLPLDDPRNSLRLSIKPDPMLHFGAPTWGSKHWVGKIYPHKTPPSEFLNYYSKSYNCIELNTSHYAIPDDNTIQGWLSKVPNNFQFCPKVIKDLSHGKTGLADKMLLAHWLDFLAKMKNNLGPCFIQLHEMFSYQDKALLFKFLESWPSEFKLTLELRHPSWFQKGMILPALADYLHKKNIGMVITDVAGRRDVLHSTVTTDWTMIRLIGNNMDQTDEDRLLEWSERIGDWQQMGVKDTYLFLHQPDDLLGVEFATLAQNIFMETGFENVPEIKLIDDQSLFSNDNF
jgi:uncharacterized protein YecE (DUF72 family)